MLSWYIAIVGDIVYAILENGHIPCVVTCTESIGSWLLVQKNN